MKTFGEQQGLMSLNSGWKFAPAEVLPIPHGHGEVYRSTKAGQGDGPRSADWDDSAWETVSLPHDWAAALPFDPAADPDGGCKIRGKGWYRRTFRLEESLRGCHILLVFEGLSATAEIWGNGQLLYRNFSGYTGFPVDFTDMAQFGEAPNLLSVFIDATAREGWWYEGAGIYRPVWLLIKPKVFLPPNGCFAKPYKGNGGIWRLSVETELCNGDDVSHSALLTVTLQNPQGAPARTAVQPVTIAPHTTQKVSLEMAVERPALWTLEHPALYQVVATLSRTDLPGDSAEPADGPDYVSFEIGFRTIEMVPERGFFLNGQQVRLKGFCNHQDHPGVGVAVPLSIKEYRMRRLLALGANAWRCAHNPDPDILTLADHLGMLVMVENRIFSSADWNLAVLREMVRESRNHPSAVFYSLFNEEPLQGTAQGRLMAAAMRRALEEEDNTRIVTAAMNGGYLEQDGAAQVLDAVGINYNPAAYDAFHALYPRIPVYGSETSSAFAVRGCYAQDQQAHLLPSLDDTPAAWGNTARDAWRPAAEKQFVAGCFVWTGLDYRGEPTPFRWPSVASFFGVLDSCGFEKDTAWLYRAMWQREPMLHLATDWQTAGTEPRRVVVFTNCERVEIYCNRELAAQGAATPYQPLDVEIPFQPGILSAVGYRDGHPCAWDTRHTAGVPAYLEVSCSKEALFGDGFDAIAVNVAIRDANGTLVPHQDRLVTFSASGGAAVIGVGNGDPNCHEPDVADYRTTFHGLVQGILRSDGTASGTVSLTVSAEGLPVVSVAIPIIPVHRIPELPPAADQIVSGFRMYGQVLDAMPDPALPESEQDMNQFEPVSFAGHTQAMLYRQHGKYALYRADITLKRACLLSIPESRGTLWVYAGRRLLGCKENLTGSITCPIPADCGPKVQLNLVLCNTDAQWGEAGILRPVRLLPQEETATSNP